MENCDKNIIGNQDDKQNCGKERFWIKFSSNGWFKEVGIKSEVVKEGQDWNRNIYFDTFEEAESFERKLKDLILAEYPRAQEEGWFDGE